MGIEQLQQLQPGLTLTGRWPGEVALIAISTHGPESATIVVRDGAGTLHEEMLFASDLARISVVAPNRHQWTFDADPLKFRLATEALRISMAGVGDPMVAVATSDISPLPHQLRAVYGELLPRTPLRFLLADDPGAGKTIMAGLYAKELLLRGDLVRMLIVAPGGLVEQWQDELSSKFGLQTTVMSRELIAASPHGDPFSGNPLLIARMDQLARNAELLSHLEKSEWDLVVVDEAHRMSASWHGPLGDLHETQRFKLGRLLGTVTRNLLLMTATPHAGNEDNFQLFLSLLDEDRFAGRPRAGATADTTGLMRRMVKEELLTFEGRPLFPERIAETVPYKLSPEEQELYDAVTHYVRNEMNRVAADDDSPRRRTVGFALTVLQRRLASSTHAVLRSLQRRRDRLTTRRADIVLGRITVDDISPSVPGNTDFDDPDEYSALEFEELEDEVVDAATAARTVAELDIEIAQLDRLVELATRVRDRGIDRKWGQLRSLLTDESLLRDADGRPRKLIIFTEHRDTLDYLTAQLRNVLGNDDAVVTIHGGTSRNDRISVREHFTNDPQRQILVATDAAGEGLNLQAAHLMINYDLPWNPNRIEQRFGRIHRIGQRNVCRLWNIVADETREGHVYARLLDKMEQQRKAYGGKLFDVLGDAFAGEPLRDLLWKAVLYGDDPRRLEEIERVVNAEVAQGCETLIAERALAHEMISRAELDRLRREMDEANARRLQPHYIEKFFRDAFGELGGRLIKREQNRFQISHVPPVLRQRDSRKTHAGRPVTRAYERVTFEPEAVPGQIRAELLAPGHPLMDELLEVTIDEQATTLRSGATLYAADDPGELPYVIVAVRGEVVDGNSRIVSKHFSFVRVDADRTVSDAGPAPHLDLQPLPESLMHSAAAPAATDFEAAALDWAATVAQPDHLQRVRNHLIPTIDKTRAAVQERLVEQINLLSSQAAQLREEQDSGKRRRRRQSPDRLAQRADDLALRLNRRDAELDRDTALRAKPPVLTAAMLVIPGGALGGEIAARARDTAATDRRAVAAVLRAEHALGRLPEEQAHNNVGYDIISETPPGPDGTRRPAIIIEVKGRITGARTCHVSFNQVHYGKNAGRDHRLALVRVSDQGPEYDEVRYLTDYFRNVDLGSTAVSAVELDWERAWSQAQAPH
ncbi:putative helicase [Gordonia hirsuta DSM 44140 = NBRC 16056]|uniref:Putative helicase n=1 Tax=Gordonia hirsuta DSM 44140 = NBRC 16056 TaxID=1121927 RepID=L7L9F0_9ACTN|nr:helicase-related protein [Gordonia hirsuta]GAC57381.1 putative helicase [Gordonia hirsuta DSM 44140 = NBRC 16056]